MNKLHFLLLITVITGMSLSGCIEEKTLRPFLLPELVNTPNYLVESFPEDSALLVGAEGGVLIRYADLQQYAFPISKHPQLGSIDPTDVEVFYSRVNETFFLLSDSLIITFNRSQVEFFSDTAGFYQPTRFYVDHCISPLGDLYRIDYHDEFWDPDGGSFFSDYFIAIRRFNPSAPNLWESRETDLTVNSNNLAVPHAVFLNEDDLLILTNPSYRISGLDDDALNAAPIERDDAFRSIAIPYANRDEGIFGFRQAPDFFSPVDELLSTNTASDEINFERISASCIPGRNVIGPVKVLQWREEEVVLFVQYFTNELTPDNDLIGYTYTLSLNGSGCRVVEVLSDNVLLPYSNTLRDVALLGGELFLATETGLLVYDIGTGGMVPYLKDLFEDKTQ